MNFQYILDKWKIKVDINTLLDIWNENGRHWHNLNHLNDLVEQINEDAKYLSEKEYDKLILTALFHDIVYDPTKTNNEEKSAEFLMSMCENKTDLEIKEIYDAIIATKTHKSINELSSKFNKYDMSIVESNMDKLLDWEFGIYEEYKFVGNDVYKENRIKFIESLLDEYPLNSDNLLKLIETVREKY